MDPTLDTVKTSLVIQRTMLESLVRPTPDLKFVPWLAESWEFAPPRQWRVKLKKGVKFHNGEDFNAESVRYTLTAYKAAKGSIRTWYAFVEEVKVIDDYTVEFVTDAPTSVLPASLAYIFPLPPKYHQEAQPEQFGQKPVGTGPWRFVSWETGNSFKVEPNPNYWGQKPAIDTIQFRWATEASTRVALLRTGEADLINNVPPQLIPQLESSQNARVETIKSIRKMFGQMNTHVEPLNDVRLRKAINYAVDVDGIIKTVFQGRAYRDKGVTIDAYPGYYADQLPDQFTYNSTRAKELLTEAGKPNGFEIDFWHPIGANMLDKESAEAIAGQLEQVGIKAHLQGLEPGSFFSKMRSNKETGMNLFGVGPLWNDAYIALQTHFLLDGQSTYGADEKTTELVKKAVRTIDNKEREGIYHDVEKYIYLEHVPWLWLWRLQDIYGASNRLNWKARPDEIITFDEITLKS